MNSLRMTTVLGLVVVFLAGAAVAADYEGEPGYVDLEWIGALRNAFLIRDPDEVVVSYTAVRADAAAEDLDKTVGETFRLYETVYQIVGIYETGVPFEDGGSVVRAWRASRQW